MSDLTFSSSGTFAGVKPGTPVTLGTGERLTVQRVSMYGVTLTPRCWWHRSRLLCWAFLR